jgi:hypothetical protein
MKKAFLLIFFLPLITFGQNYIGETKEFIKNSFLNNVNKESPWIFKDSVISALCCIEYDNREGIFYDTTSVWKAKIECCYEYQYFFNLTMLQDCDSIFISYRCDSCGYKDASGFIENSFPVKWRILDSNLFVQYYTYGIDADYYRVPKMKLTYNQQSINNISIWIEYLNKADYKKIKTLEKIKTLPNNTSYEK